MKPSSQSSLAFIPKQSGLHPNAIWPSSHAPAFGKKSPTHIDVAGMTLTAVLILYVA
jgi:hypothetical protein